MKIIDAQGESTNNEVTIKSCDSEEEAKNYLIAFAKDFHFLLYNDDTAAINPARIRKIFIDTKYFHCVCAEVEGHYVATIPLKKFNSGDWEKDSKDAEEYFTEVVKFLNEQLNF